MTAIQAFVTAGGGAVLLVMLLASGIQAPATLATPRDVPGQEHQLSQADEQVGDPAAAPLSIQ